MSSGYDRDHARRSNDGTRWSKAALFDLRWHWSHGKSLQETAMFLYRNERSVAQKALELGCSFRPARRKPELINVRLIPWGAKAGGASRKSSTTG